MKLKDLILIVIGVCLVGGGLWFFFHRTKIKGNQKISPIHSDVALDTNLTLALAFHPTQVTRFSWVTESNASHSFDWPIEEDHLTEGLRQAAQNRLDLLARIHSNDVKRSSNENESMKFSIKFKDGSTWTGAMAKDWVFWTSGPYKLKGTKLNSDQVLLMTNEMLPGPEAKLVLCSHRITRIGSQTNKIDFEFKAFQWHDLTRERAAQSPSIGTLVEDWLAQYCTVEIDSTFISSILDGLKPIDQIELIDQVKQAQSFKVFKKAKSNQLLFSIEQKGQKRVFASKQLAKAYDQLNQMAELK